MYDIITVGEILAEILTSERNQLLSKSGPLMGPYPSGAPAIMIDQAALMGVDAAIIAKVGSDAFGKMNLEKLQTDGVDISNVIVDQDNSTGVAFVTYFDDGNREFLFHFKHAACGTLSPEEINLNAIAESKFLHIMGCTVTGSPQLAKSVMHAINVAKRNNVRISFDPNLRPELYSGEIISLYEEILNNSEILLAGKSELNLLYGGELEAKAAFLKQPEKILVVKDGSRSTRLYSSEEAFETATMKAKELDPTGAGDCFDATFLAMLCRGADLKTAVQYANTAGALAVSQKGPMSGNSTYNKIREVLNQHGPLSVKEL